MSDATLPFIAVGAAACAYSLFQIGRSAAASRWPSTDGEIAETQFVDRPGEDASPHEYVAYRYRVNGQPFRNDRVRFGLAVVGPSSRIPGVSTSRDANGSGLADRYPTRTPVRVHYNPRRPEDSVLRIAPDWTVWLLLVIGVASLYVGLTASV